MTNGYIVDQNWNGQEGQVCLKGWLPCKLFSTIQGAINAAVKARRKSPYINVAPGTYAEQITWPAGVKIMGSGAVASPK